MSKSRVGKAFGWFRFGAWPFIVGCILLFVFLSMLWLQGASRELDNILVSTARETSANFNAMIGLVMHYRADSIISCGLITHDSSTESLVRIAQGYDLDEVNVFARSGRLLGSNQTQSMDRVAGVDLRSISYLRPYFELFNRPEGFVCETFRRPVQNTNIWVKYVGIYEPKTDCVVQLGYSAEHFLRHVNRYFRPLIQDATFSSEGFFVAAPDESEKILTAHQDHIELVGKRLQDLCSMRACPEWLLFLSPLFGQRYRCYPVSLIGNHDYRIYALISTDSVYRYAYYYIRVFAVLMLVFCLVCVLADWALRRERRKSERLSMRELATAHAIQMSELQSAPLDTPFLSVTALMEPARQVGGDFYDYCELGDGRLVVMVADVSDKGVPAAIFMMKARLILRGFLDSCESLAEAVACANERLNGNNAGRMFVTAFVGLFDRVTGKLEWVSAGHNMPILRHADGSLEWARGRRSLVLGLRKGVRYHAETMQLSVGDQLLLYTDGVTEATGAHDKLYGEKRLEQAVRRGGDLVGVVRRDVAAFVDDVEQSDDLTLLELRVKSLEKGLYPNSMEGLSAATDKLAADLEALACPPEILSRFLLAFDEIAGNVVRYSRAQEFFVVLAYRSGSLSVQVSDDGRAFDPTAQAEPDISDATRDRKRGGLGIFLTRRMVDSITYRRILGRNVTTLRLGLLPDANA